MLSLLLTVALFISKAERRRDAVEEKDKKQIPLRLSITLWRELSAWAEDDFRSLNGQIEYLLSDAVKRRKRKSDDSA